MNLDDPDGELAWKGEKEKNFGSVCADWEVGVRGIYAGEKKRGREREREKLDWRGEDWATR